jgi:hypothetical protein
LVYDYNLIIKYYHNYKIKMMKYWSTIIALSLQFNYKAQSFLIISNVRSKSRYMQREDNNIELVTPKVGAEMPEGRRPDWF